MAAAGGPGLVPGTAEAQVVLSGDRALIGPNRVETLTPLKPGLNIAPNTEGRHIVNFPAQGRLVIENDEGLLRLNASGAFGLEIRSFNRGAVTVLVGNNDYDGPTLIGGGATLSLGGSNIFPDRSTLNIESRGLFELRGFSDTIGGLSGTGIVDLQRGSLTTGANGASTVFAGPIIGTGSLVKTGSGMLTLDGDSTFTGSTAVEQGILRVNGRLSSGVTVRGTGRLEGLGRIGALLNRGVVAPGASIGTLTVNGRFTQSADGALEIEIAPDGRSDRLDVKGPAELDGTLIVIPESGNYNAGTRYGILSAESVSGSFRETVVRNAGTLGDLAAVPTYESGRVLLVLVPRSQESAARQEAPREQAAGVVNRTINRVLVVSVSNRIFGALRGLQRSVVPVRTPDGATPRLPDATPRLPDATPRLPDATPRLPDAEPGGAPTTLPRDGREPGEREGSGVGGGETATGLSLWGDASVTYLEKTRQDNQQSGVLEVGLVGADLQMTDDLLVGVAFGLDYADIHLRTAEAKIDAIAGTVSLYAGYRFDDSVYVDALVGYGRASNVSRQDILLEKVVGVYASNRYFGGINLTLQQQIDDFTLAAKLGYAHSLESFDVYTSSDGARVGLGPSHIGTLRLSAEVGVTVFDTLHPYVTAGVEKDVLNLAGAGERLGGFLGAGLFGQVSDQLTLGAIFNTNFGRGEETQYQAGLNLRYMW